MIDTPEFLRQRLAEQPKLKPFCDEHNLPYFRMREFLKNQGVGLRFEQMNRLSIALTGNPLRPCCGEVEA